MDEGESVEGVRTWPRVLAVLAALAGPLIGLLYVVLLARGADRAWELARDASMLPVLAVAVLVGIAIAVLAALAPVRSIPAVVPIGLALVPWALGSVLGLVAASGASSAAAAAPAERSMLLAAAVSGTIGARAIGSALSAGLLGAIGAAWAWASFAPRGPRRVLVGLAVGMGLGVLLQVLLVGLSVAVPWARDAGVYPWWEAFPAALAGGRGEAGWSAFAGAVSQLGFVVFLGSASATEGPASPRVASLFAAACGALIFELCASIAAAACAGASQVFSAVAGADEDTRTMFVARGGEELESLVIFFTLATVVALSIAGLALFRARPRPAPSERPWLGAAMVAAVGLGAIVLHVVSVLGSRALVASAVGGTELDVLTGLVF